MKITTKGRYALRMLIDIAQNSNGNYISLSDISDRQNISKKYLEQIVPHLNKAGILTTLRGHNGGYKLAKEPSEFTIGKILDVIEGGMAPVSCLDCEVNTCERKDDCLTLPLWTGLERVMTEYLYGITLQDLLQGNIK